MIKIVKTAVELYNLRFTFPSGTTEETIDKFQDAIESWNATHHGGGWFNLEANETGSLPVFDLSMDLTEEQADDLEHYLKGKGL